MIRHTRLLSGPLYAFVARGTPILFFVLLLLVAPVALAHGGGTLQLENAPAGPYVVSVWASPHPPQVGAYHVTVSVARPGDGGGAGEPVLGADVAVRLTPQGAGEALTARASNEAADNKLFYEADVELPAPGVYDVAVAVAGPDGRGETAFAIAVEEGGGVNWGLIGTAALVVLAAAFVVSAAVRGRRQQAAKGR